VGSNVAASGSGYRVDYFWRRGGEAGGHVLFKKVDHPGRRRPAVFALVGRGWVPASGLWARVLDTPEWDGRAEPISPERVRELLATDGWDPEEVDYLLAGREGQRRYPRAD
jgi:hypothetical protein